MRAADREPRRDRLPDRPHRPPARDLDGRRVLRARPQRAARRLRSTSPSRSAGRRRRESYLRGDAIIQAALDTGATAIHPGYGFLAENAEFAEAVIDAGLTWVGPTPDQIRLLGDKVAAKRAAIEAGVPTTDDRRGRRPATIPDGDLTMPVLVKAAAGGGGPRHARRARRRRSRRRGRGGQPRGGVGVRRRHRVHRAVHRARPPRRGADPRRRSTATSSTSATASARSSAATRRSSRSRRRPASPTTCGRRLHDGALALARHVGYVGAGTVEFMVGEAADGEPTITFLEVNTRLQVEHPVTEAVTGIDLVEMQLRVAAGEALPFAQDDVTFDGPRDRGAARRRGSGSRVVALDRHGHRVRDPRRGPGRHRVPSRQRGLVRLRLAARQGDRPPRRPRRRRAADRPGAAQRTHHRRPHQRRHAGGDHGRARLPGGPHADVVPRRAPRRRSATTGPVGDDRLALLLGAVFADRARQPRRRRRHRVRPVGVAQPAHPRATPHAGCCGDDRALASSTSLRRTDRPSARVGPWPEPRTPTAVVPARRPTTGGRHGPRCCDRSPTGEVIEIDGRRHVVDDRLRRRRRCAPRAPAGSLDWTRPARFVDHDADEAGSGPVCPLPGTVIAVHVEAGETRRRRAAADGGRGDEDGAQDHRPRRPRRRGACTSRSATGSTPATCWCRSNAGRTVTPTDGRADPHRQLLGVLRRPAVRRPRDGRGRPDRRAHRRLAGRADDADPQPDPGQAARAAASRRTFVTPDGAGDGHLPRSRASRSCRTPAGSIPTAAPRPCTRSPTGSGSSPTIAYVDGDDLLPRIAELADAGALQPFDDRRRPRRRRPLPHRQRLPRLLGHRRRARSAAPTS